MARFTTIRGPAVSFQPGGGIATIPGLSVTRHFQGGPVLILFTCMVENFTGILQNLTLDLTLDATRISGFAYLNEVSNNHRVLPNLHHMILIPCGTHTIAARANGPNSADFLIIADNAYFTIIELPEWDQDDQVVIL